MARMNFSALALVVLTSAAFTQQREATHNRANTELNGTGCVLSTASNGQVITTHGKTFQGPHDMGFRISGCEDIVLLTYAGDRDNDVVADELQNDAKLKQFQNYTSATYKSTNRSICTGCTKYGDVEATLTGKLEIASMPPDATKDQLGFV